MREKGQRGGCCYAVVRSSLTVAGRSQFGSRRAAAVRSARLTRQARGKRASTQRRGTETRGFGDAPDALTRAVDDHRRPRARQRKRCARAYRLPAPAAPGTDTPGAAAWRRSHDRSTMRARTRGARPATWVGGWWRRWHDRRGSEAWGRPCPQCTCPRPCCPCVLSAGGRHPCGRG